MSTAAEAAVSRTPLGADLKAGVDAISYDQKITFTKYVQMILPLDGYVFWVRGDLLTPSQAETRTVMGSFHYATDQHQDEAQTFSINRVIFTAQSQIDFFNTINPTTLYLAEYEGLTFAFSSRGNFYRQAAIWHYVGNAIYSDMRSQIITTADQLAALGPLIVSNSLPVWLGLNTFTPNWPFYPSLPLPFRLYPSFLNPQNLAPPWAAVHIGENNTDPLVSAPFFQPTQSQEQFSYDHVRITLWGATNAMAQNFIATVNQFSYDTGLIGIMNRPIIRDAKRTQNEIEALAQKKIIEYTVSYIQGNVVNFTRQLITSAIPTYVPQPL